MCVCLCEICREAVCVCLCEICQGMLCMYIQSVRGIGVGARVHREVLTFIQHTQATWWTLVQLLWV